MSIVHRQFCKVPGCSGEPVVKAYFKVGAKEIEGHFCKEHHAQLTDLWWKGQRYDEPELFNKGA